VINKDGHRIVRNHKSDNKKLYDLPGEYNFLIGTKKVLDIDKISFFIQEGQAPMEM
jgi:hypothetical protein